MLFYIFYVIYFCSCSRPYGFHAYVGDWISAPEPVMQYLQDSYCIMDIPVAHDPVENVQLVMDRCPELRMFIAGNHLVRFRTSTHYVVT